MKNDTEILVSIVKEMAESTTGVQSTTHWAEDALWFDIPPFASKGKAAAIKMFDSVFENFRSCKILILDTEAIVDESMGIVCTIQKADIVFKNDVRKLTDAKIKTDPRINGGLFHGYISGKNRLSLFWAAARRAMRGAGMRAIRAAGLCRLSFLCRCLRFPVAGKGCRAQCQQANTCQFHQ